MIRVKEERETHMFTMKELHQEWEELLHNQLLVQQQDSLPQVYQEAGQVPHLPSSQEEHQPSDAHHASLSSTVYIRKT